MQLLTKSFCPSAIVFAFTGTGFGRFTAVGGAFQSELCASSGPPIDKTASPISALEQRAAEFRDFIDLSNVELQKCVWLRVFCVFVTAACDNSPSLDQVDGALRIGERVLLDLVGRPGRAASVSAP